MEILQCCMCRYVSYMVYIVVYELRLSRFYFIFIFIFSFFFTFFFSAHSSFTRFKTHTQENKARRLPTERTKRCDFRMQLPALFAILSTDLVFEFLFWLLLLLDSFFLFFTFNHLPIAVYFRIMCVVRVFFCLFIRSFILSSISLSLSLRGYFKIKKKKSISFFKFFQIFCHFCFFRLLFGRCWDHKKRNRKLCTWQTEYDW